MAVDVGQRKERISHVARREVEDRPHLKRLAAASVMQRYLGSTAVAGPGRRSPGRGVLKCALLEPSGQLLSEHGLNVRVLQRWLGSQELEAVARLKMRWQANLHAGVTPSVWMRRAKMCRRSMMEVNMNSTCTALLVRVYGQARAHVVRSPEGSASCAVLSCHSGLITGRRRALHALRLAATNTTAESSNVLEEDDMAVTVGAPARAGVYCPDSFKSRYSVQVTRHCARLGTDSESAVTDSSPSRTLSVRHSGCQCCQCTVTPRACGLCGCMMRVIKPSYQTQLIASMVKYLSRAARPNVLPRRIDGGRRHTTVVPLKHD